MTTNAPHMNEQMKADTQMNRRMHICMITSHKVASCEDEGEHDDGCQGLRSLGDHDNGAQQQPI